MRASRLLPLALTLALTLGCSGEPDAPAATPAGTYTLARAAGQPIPAVIQVNPRTTLTIEGGQLLLGADGRYTLTAQHRYRGDPPEGLIGIVEQGVWAASGTTLTLTVTPGGTVRTGVIVPTQATVPRGDYIYEFARP